MDMAWKGAELVLWLWKKWLEFITLPQLFQTVHEQTRMLPPPWIGAMTETKRNEAHFLSLMILHFCLHILLHLDSINPDCFMGLAMEFGINIQHS